MQLSIQRQHATMLLKYSGISFISGAVNHGFFSGERSLWTAAAGIVLFVGGAWLEHRLAGDRTGGPVWRTLLWGTLLSIGLGFFTGGLQHFPDSPARSAWVVPAGFVLSAVALVAQAGIRLTPRLAASTLATAVAVALASAAGWQWLERQPASVEAHGHDHGSPDALVAQVVDRTVEVRMLDQMRFEPQDLRVAAGETVRLAVRNEGRLLHELVIGSEQAIREHARSMRSDATHPHGRSGAAAIQLPGGGSGELVVTIRESGTLQFACLVPGHYEAGMRGTLTAAAAPPSQDPAAAPPAASAHGKHRH